MVICHEKYGSKTDGSQSKSAGLKQPNTQEPPENYG